MYLCLSMYDISELKSFKEKHWLYLQAIWLLQVTFQ